ncbi:ABC transporter ATP-binding protein [Chitinophaga ginsengisegetis]|uniref:ABC transporter ATP-binding protein n=1 Tax=Chitinophaga ginsengisegetis TaxID=393003 RepID=UPI000DBAC64A|nr:ABC transporter ATP-binding protein [Chitinophaga ginsengisegetis]MDR6565160.1 ATP-binding cassette subfamily B protein [Chitinophaga ginsengisegetis]MDR6644887.1 ATP-binding cassette subfamily B protein [Chitinophaga ginsengisegetis]MDR6652521.1 ATP-binding cassette subfamily B protein [Chitinophaga ginsengisegetis]
MKVLWNYLKPHKWLVILSLLLAGVSQVLVMTDPLIFGKIIDDYAGKVNSMPEKQLVNGVLFWLGVAVVIALLARLAKSFQEYFLRLVVQKFGMQVFNDGLKQTLRLSFEEYEEQRSGETLAVLQKVRTDTERFITAFINILFTSLVGMGFLIWYAITKHWALIPVFVVGIIFLGGLTGLLSKKMKTVQRAINRETLQLSGAITESLRNIELVKSLGLTFPEIRRLKTFTKEIFDLEMEKTRQVRTLSFLQGTTLNILKQSILFILLWLIFRNILTTGELITMQFITTAIFVPLQDLGNIIIQYREAEASLQLFHKLMQRPVEERPEEPVEIGDLQQMRFEDVVFRHKTAAINAIDHISFAVETGDTIAFVGPSGSGKSTLVKLLVGLYKPVEGEIYFNDVPSGDIRYNALRRQIGFVTQDTQLFAGTIKENLLFVKSDATDEEVIEALEKASCTALLARSGKGIYARLGEGGVKLSGGEKQRISIARALIRHPRLLIFDEATSALDSITEEAITDTVRSISARREQITILIAHRLSTIMHADRIIVLEKGKIAETGTHEELVEHKGLYYAMWRQQIGERRTAELSVEKKAPEEDEDPEWDAL